MLQLGIRGILISCTLIAWLISIVQPNAAHHPSFLAIALTILLLSAVFEFSLYIALKYGHNSCVDC